MNRMLVLDTQRERLISLGGRLTGLPEAASHPLTIANYIKFFTDPYYTNIFFTTIVFVLDASASVLSP